jgi:hypothetical protein
MNGRNNKSFAVNYFVAEGFLGHIIFVLCQGLGSEKCSTTGKKNQILLRAN